MPAIYIYTMEPIILERMTLDAFLLYLADATTSIPEEYKKRVFHTMAEKLMEWDNITVEQIRAAFAKLDMTFEERVAPAGPKIHRS